MRSPTTIAILAALCACGPAVDTGADVEPSVDPAIEACAASLPAQIPLPEDVHDTRISFDGSGFWLLMAHDTEPGEQRLTAQRLACDGSPASEPEILEDAAPGTNFDRLAAASSADRTLLAWDRVSETGGEWVVRYAVFDAAGGRVAAPTTLAHGTDHAFASLIGAGATADGWDVGFSVWSGPDEERLRVASISDAGDAAAAKLDARIEIPDDELFAAADFVVTPAGALAAVTVSDWLDFETRIRGIDTPWQTLPTEVGRIALGSGPAGTFWVESGASHTIHAWPDGPTLLVPGGNSKSVSFVHASDDHVFGIVSSLGSGAPTRALRMSANLDDVEDVSLPGKDRPMTGYVNVGEHTLVVASKQLPPWLGDPVPPEAWLDIVRFPAAE